VDFSRVSIEQFSRLFNELLMAKDISFAGLSLPLGMPSNSLFDLKAFKKASRIDFMYKPDYETLTVNHPRFSAEKLSEWIHTKGEKCELHVCENFLGVEGVSELINRCVKIVFNNF
jgi:hypothetical protein